MRKLLLLVAMGIIPLLLVGCEETVVVKPHYRHAHCKRVIYKRVCHRSRGCYRVRRVRWVC